MEYILILIILFIFYKIFSLGETKNKNHQYYNSTKFE